MNWIVHQDYTPTSSKMNRVIAIPLLFLLFMSGATRASGQSTSSNTAESQTAGERKPDLLPILHMPMSSEIQVKNIGNGPARPSKLALDCVTIIATPLLRNCPDLPFFVGSVYFDQTVPINATIEVPALAPGETFTRKIPFWDLSNWPRGKYEFTATVDAAAHELSEGNCKNNVATSVLIIRKPAPLAPQSRARTRISLRCGSANRAALAMLMFNCCNQLSDECRGATRF